MKRPMCLLLAALSLLLAGGCMLIGSSDSKAPAATSGPAPVREISITGDDSSVTLSREAAANARISVMGNRSHVEIKD